MFFYSLLRIRRATGIKSATDPIEWAQPTSVEADTGHGDFLHCSSLLHRAVRERVTLWLSRLPGSPRKMTTISSPFSRSFSLRKLSLINLFILFLCAAAGIHFLERAIPRRAVSMPLGLARRTRQESAKRLADLKTSWYSTGLVSLFVRGNRQDLMVTLRITQTVSFFPWLVVP